jgi:hypothetical protein
MIVMLALGAQASSLNSETDTVAGANPIRKVVTMLQKIQTKVAAEAKTEQDLFDKFMCYCKNGAADLDASIQSSDVKIPEVESAIKEAEAMKVQLAADLVAHQADRTEAKATMEKAAGIRGKEAKVFSAFKAESDANIGALTKAVNSLETGMGGAFLQTNTAQVVRNLLMGTKVEVADLDRDTVLAFLSSKEGYMPQSGQITGILKTIGDDMKKALAEATEEENGSIKTFGELMAAKTKEVNALTAAIEEKTIRSGETAVNIVSMKNDLSTTEKALLDDKKFLADLGKNCETKKAEWADISKARADEQVALADTIKLLNDDDALELFKKTLPGAAASFVQEASHSAKKQAKALAMIAAVKVKSARPERLDFIMLALHGKKQGFEKVIKMIDNMIGTLKTEQTDDDNKKQYCATALDASDDKRKGLEQSISDSEAAMEDAEETVATLTSELKALVKGIKALDKSVAEATEQRQKENEEYTVLISENSAAIELVGMAKNRLNKFYNPALYNPPPKRELSEEERIAVSMGGTAPPTPAPGGIAGTGISAFAEVGVHMQDLNQADPGPAPTAPKAYSKSEESTGVIAMMDLLIKDLEKEINVAKTEETDAQRDYEQMAGEAAEKRAADSSAIVQKTNFKAETETALQMHKESKASATKELLGTVEYIQTLHSECDWLMKYFDTRKEARASEVEALANAKSVLSGADYSLVQKTAQLRGALRVQGNVNDKILFNDNVVMEGDNVAVGCHQAPRESTKVSVCGAGYKVVANLLTECQGYQGYSETVGFCDSGKSGCDTKELESGYTEKFNWQAVSYEVVHC